MLLTQENVSVQFGSKVAVSNAVNLIIHNMLITNT